MVNPFLLKTGHSMEEWSGPSAHRGPHIGKLHSGQRKQEERSSISLLLFKKNYKHIYFVFLFKKVFTCSIRGTAVSF